MVGTLLVKDGTHIIAQAKTNPEIAKNIVSPKLYLKKFMAPVLRKGIKQRKQRKLCPSGILGWEYSVAVSQSVTSCFLFSSSFVLFLFPTVGTEFLESFILPQDCAVPHIRGHILEETPFDCFNQRKQALGNGEVMSPQLHNGEFDFMEQSPCSPPG